MANQTPKGLLDLTTQLPKGLLDVGWEKPVETEPFTLIDVDMGETIKGLAVDMDQVIDDLSFRSSTHEVSEPYKKADPNSAGLMSILSKN